MRRVLLLITLVLGLLAGCGGGGDGSSTEASSSQHTTTAAGTTAAPTTAAGTTAAPTMQPTMQVHSSALSAGQPIPQRFTCDGAGTSPPLSWSGTPSDAQALAIVVDDPDAPGGTFVHWVVLDVPAQVTSVDEGSVPAGGVQATNSADGTGYTPPCPPNGTHHYRFTVYALAHPTGLSEGVDFDTALQAITSSAIAYGRLTATYSTQG